MKIIGADTDSCFIELENANIFTIKEKSFELENIINNSFDEFVKEFGLKKHCFHIKLEKICKSILFVPKKGKEGVAKKRYAYIPLWQDGKSGTDIVYSGFQNKRCDNSKLAKKVQKFIIKQILEDNKTNVLPIVKMIEAGIKENCFDNNEIGIPGGYSRKIDEYKSVPISVRSAENSNKLFGTNFSKGDRFFWCYVTSEIYPENVIAFEKDIPTGFSLDTDEMIRRTLSGPLETIFEAIGLKWSDYFIKIKKKVKIKEKTQCLLKEYGK